MVIILKWFQVDQKLEFPRNRLMLDETIGEGEFGRVPFDILYFIFWYKHLTFDVLTGYHLMFYILYINIWYFGRVWFMLKRTLHWNQISWSYFKSIKQQLFQANLWLKLDQLKTTSFDKSGPNKNTFRWNLGGHLIYPQRQATPGMIIMILRGSTERDD